MVSIQTVAGRLTCLVDGAGVFGPEVFPDLPEAQRAALLEQAGETEVRCNFNAFLIEADVITLVDCGGGHLMGDKAGRLAGLLEARGIGPAQVTRIIYTHLHSDHCGGALTPDGTPVYPNAEVILQEAELAFWQGRDAPGGRMLAAYAGRLRPVAGAADLGQGQTCWPLPGHTPGHMGLWLGDQAALVGDIVHAEHLQFPDPTIATRYDNDPAQARASRQTALARLAARGLPFGGGHLLAPDSLARVRAVDAGFARI